MLRICSAFSKKSRCQTEHRNSAPPALNKAKSSYGSEETDQDAAIQ